MICSSPASATRPVPPVVNTDYAEAIYQLVARMGTKEQHAAEELLTPDQRNAADGIDASISLT